MTKDHEPKVTLPEQPDEFITNLASAVGARLRAVNDGKGPLDVTKLLESGEWVYRDIPWTPEPVWDAMLTLIGEPNYRLLTSTLKDGYRRGQILLHRDGSRQFTERLPEFKAIAEKHYGPTPSVTH